MAFDAFLKIEGIEGDSLQKGHPGEIELSSFSWGETNPTNPATGGGGGTGKVQMQDFHFSMATSKASPQLHQFCASGQRVREATLTCRKAGAEQFEFLKIKLTDVLISSYAVGGSSGDDNPGDQASMAFVKLDMTFFEQGPKG